jgi:molybdate transport system substrate-binding protein
MVRHPRAGAPALVDALVASTIALTPAHGAEIKVLNANALTLAMKAIAADFTKETGHTVTFAGMSPGRVEERIKAGESYDLVINATASAQAFEKEGRWRAGSRKPFARVGIGVAAREGAKLDLSSVESTRKALLDAKSLTMSDSRTGGLSGKNAQKVLANLGLTDAVKDKLRLTPDGQQLIGKGEIELGLYNVSEIPRAKGVVLAGAVPAAVQVYINYDSALPATNASPDNAIALLNFFARPAYRAVWTKAGLEFVGKP